MGWQYVPKLYTEVEVTNMVNKMWIVPLGVDVSCLWAKIRPKQLTLIVNKRIMLYHRDEYETDDYDIIMDIIMESIRMVMYKEQYNQMMKIVNEATPLCP